jgi:hypothetical protein
VTPRELKLNQIAQGLIAWDAGVEWFEACTEAEKSVILRELGFIVNQAHPLVAEVQRAIEKSGLMSTFTPCVLALKSNPPERAINKIITLPEPERLKSFKLLLALFSIADLRRRSTVCKGGCTHEWHNLGASAA